MDENALIRALNSVYDDLADHPTHLDKKDMTVL